MEVRSTDAAYAVPQTERETLDFRAVYEAWFHEVCRWLRSLGGPDAELEDLAQEVFLVVRRKLSGFDGRNLGGWLYRITARTMSDHRRRAWFKNLFVRRREAPLEKMAATSEDPAQALERRDDERLVFRLLARMNEKRRTVLALHEIEGYSGEEIAALQGIPPATVRTRLHHARKEFAERLQRARREEERR